MSNSKEEALQNINVKIDILKSWLAEGIPFRSDGDGFEILDSKDNKILDYVPTTIRQFLHWNGSQNCDFIKKNLPPIRSLNNSTLVQHKNHKLEVESLVNALKEKAILQLQQTSKSEIKNLQTKLCEIEINLQHTLLENIILRRNFQDVEKKYRALLRSTEGHEKAYQKNYQAMESKIERLKSQNSELTQSLVNIHPISVSRDDHK